jgi:4-hydroxy-tetrahydrodipicolinate synthase
VLYNVPGRTITDIGVPVMHRLAEEYQSIIGIKDATGNLGRVTAQRLACGPDFLQLSGNDETALGFNAMGGVGCISVTANVAPRLCAEFQGRDGGGGMGQGARISGQIISAARCVVQRFFTGAD